MSSKKFLQKNSPPKSQKIPNKIQKNPKTISEKIPKILKKQFPTSHLEAENPFRACFYFFYKHNTFFQRQLHVITYFQIRVQLLFPGCVLTIECLILIVPNHSKNSFFPAFSLVWRKSKCKQNCKMQVYLDTVAIKSLFSDSLMNDFLHWMKEPWKQTSYLLYK